MVVYTRRNGKFFLQIRGHPQFGLPFGQDWLIPIWVATLALRQRSRTVHFSTATEMLDFFQDGSDTTASWMASSASSPQRSSFEPATNLRPGGYWTGLGFTSLIAYTSGFGSHEWWMRFWPLPI
jgi:hypothetical protein